MDNLKSFFTNPSDELNINQEQTNINNGMMTRVWGPPGWFFLHCVTFGYPVDPAKFDNEKELEPGTTAELYRNFFISVGGVLPCKYCRESYKEFVKELPPDVTNRDTLVKWFWEIHNKVNNKLEDKYGDASLEDVKTRYERYRAKCATKQVARGCSVPLSGKKMCTKIKTMYCDDNAVKRDIILFLIFCFIFIVGRVIFGFVAENVFG